MKSKTVAYLLWFFLGGFSMHRFYLGKVGSGILYFLTGQLFLIGWFVDFFLISGMVERYNLQNRMNGPGQHISQNVVINIPGTPQATGLNTPPPAAPLNQAAQASINESYQTHEEEEQTNQYKDQDLV